MVLIVSCELYVGLLLRTDNDGEGGLLALGRAAHAGPSVGIIGQSAVSMLGMVGAACLGEGVGRRRGVDLLLV